MSLLHRAARTALRSAASRASLRASLRASAVAPSSSAARPFSSASASAAGGEVVRVDNPYSGETVAEIPCLTSSGASALVAESEAAFQSWRHSKLSERIALLQSWMKEFAARKEALALDITNQMGKPLSQARGEVDTAIKRAAALLELAPEALGEEPVTQDPNPALLRKITKEPIGVVLALVPWNYPLLCAVNTVVAAVLAGNSVLLKHSERTPLCSEAFEASFAAAGAPKNLVRAFHASHALLPQVLRHPSVAYVQFTGSVGGGRAVYAATAASRFIDVGLELGGKDAAYVASDADLPYAISNVVDGAMYNAGQSCCAVERVFVHDKHYDAFVEGAKQSLQQYVLGDPKLEATNMGPIAQAAHVAFLEAQVAEAAQLGARVLLGGKPTSDATGKGRFFQPTLVADATAQMRVLREESFGPILAVSKVSSDAAAVRAINDSEFGLTASIWSADLERAANLAQQLQVGTVYMNRCDFLDPYLAWSGRKDSGKGIGLSKFGFAPFYRTKSWNFRPSTK